MSKLYARFSSMNAGKSLQLLSAAYGYRERDQEVMLFTAGIDDRSGAGKISSRVGISAEANVFKQDTKFSLGMVPKDIECIFVDESQFLTEEQVRDLHRLANSEGGLPVMCFGLRTDFRGLPFPGSAMMMCLADDISEVKTACKCGRKASMNIRLNEDGSRVREGAQIEIGGNAGYDSVCSDCFYKGE